MGKFKFCGGITSYCLVLESLVGFCELDSHEKHFLAHPPWIDWLLEKRILICPLRVCLQKLVFFPGHSDIFFSSAFLIRKSHLEASSRR